ncbi:hypothetical protein CTAYLR_009081 [Chrysophaeum taylorii]|uniref:Kinesin-like protein n=1 Tax=Chrysophaeum taylorii TaxID=2483200 RepID=A0AAD7UM14_9STRA|nr:hypothetical protein CTAYLR_009081 [Chrysophaeum taylorii]
MPTRRGSLAQGQPVAESAMRSVPGDQIYEAAQGRESFESCEEDGIPVKVLSKAFDVAAMGPPPTTKAPAAPEDEEALRVFCRMRPLGARETAGPIGALDATTVRATLQRHRSASAKDFSFTHVFDAEASQEEVYGRTTAPLVDALFEGRSGLLFTYGVTNAGKSYTMMGTGEEPLRAGILPRALGAVLERAQATNDCVCMSFLEIYNENVYDLMDKASATAPTAWASTARRRALRLKDLGNRMEVNNLSSVRVTTIAQGLALARAAEAQRKTAATGLNATSSRSHSICQLEVRSTFEAVHRSQPKAQMMLVDLAGSERVDRTGATGPMQKEANHINQSVSRLMHCLRVMRENQNNGTSVVPWRDSKLTHLFQYLLAPSNAAKKARVSMIVNVSPSIDDLQESVFVMGNAASAKAVAIRQQPAPQHRAATAPARYDRNGRRVVAAAAVSAAVSAEDQPRLKRPADKPVEALERETTSTARGSESSTASHIAALDAQIAQLTEALATAREQLGYVEQDVRKECAEEMARTIEEIQQDYARRLRARSTTFDNNKRFKTALCRSARKEQTRADLEQYIEDLEEQFEETEAELERVRAEKDKEVRALKKQLGRDCYEVEEPDATAARASDDEARAEAAAWRCVAEDAQRRLEAAELRVDALQAEASALGALRDLALVHVSELESRRDVAEAALAAANAQAANLRELPMQIYDEQPPPPPARAARSPLKENSPVFAHRSVKAAAQSLDARARKIKDERVARQRAQHQQKASGSPVANRTRAYKLV